MSSYGNSDIGRVALLGTPKSGKTVFFTMLYYVGSTLPSGVKVAIRRGEEKMGAYLRSILAGKWPDPTTYQIEQLGLELTLQAKMFGIPYEKRVVVETPDYSGELLIPDKSPLPGLAKMIRDKVDISGNELALLNFILDADAYIFVLDPVLPVTSQDEREGKIDRIALETTGITLVNKLRDEGMIDKPILALLTKSDTRGEKSPQELEKFARENFSRFFSQMESCWSKDCISFRSVGLKIVGRHPSVTLTPLGYHEVLEWLLTSL